MILALDPATKAKDRGWCLGLPSGLILDAGSGNFCEQGPSLVVETVAVESQWVAPQKTNARGKKTRAGAASLLPLARAAGYLLGLWAGQYGARALVIPVLEWKALVIPRFATAPGDVYTANLQQMFRAEGLTGDWLENHNAVDAAGIYRAVTLATPAQLKKWEFR